MNSVKEIRDAMLLSLEGGQFHAREKIKESGTLAYADFLSIGLALKECFVNPQRHEELIERLKAHVDVIIGVLLHANKTVAFHHSNAARLRQLH